MKKQLDNFTLSWGEGEDCKHPKARAGQRQTCVFLNAQAHNFTTRTVSDKNNYNLFLPNINICA